MNKPRNNTSKAGALQILGAKVAPDQAGTRPMRSLLRELTLLRGPDTDRERIDRLAISAETSMRAIHLGLGALGHLVARSSLDIRDGSVPADVMENLGFLMAELGDLAAECMRVASECRLRSEREAGRGNAQDS